MTKYINYGFTLNLDKPKQEHKPKSKKAISRKCLCVVIKDTDGTLKARIINSPSISESIVIPFTDKSFDVYNKEYVFTKHTDERGRHILVIRNSFEASLVRGDAREEYACYSPIVEKIVLSGYIIKDNDKMYFDYDDFIAFRETAPHFNPCNIDEEAPLFK